MSFSSPERSRAHRLRRALAILGRSISLAIVFVVALAAAVVLHIGVPPARRIATREVNALVSSLIVADLRIESIEHVSNRGLRVSRAALVDRTGQVVLAVEGVDARFELIPLLRGIFDPSAVRVFVPDVRVRHAVFNVLRDSERGGVTIETAFDLVDASDDGAPASPVYVQLPRIAIGAADIGTNLSGLEKAKAHLEPLDFGLDVSPDRVRLTAVSEGTRIDEILARALEGRLESVIDLPGVIDGKFALHAGQAPVRGDVRIDGSTFRMGLRSDLLTPQAMEELVSGWPLRRPLEASVHAAGPLESMQVGLHAAAGPTRVFADGTLVLDPPFRTQLGLTAEGLDLELFTDSAPKTALDLRGTVDIALTETLTVELDATVAATAVEGYAVPELKVHARYADGEVTASATSGSRLPLHVDATVSPEGAVEFSVRARELNLRTLAPYGVSARGTLTAQADGTVQDGRLQGTVELAIRSLDVEGVAAGSAVVRGKVSGPIGEPERLRVQAHVEGLGVSSGGLAFESVAIDTAGVAGDQSIEVSARQRSGLTLDGKARMDLRRPITASNVSVRSQHGGESSTTRVSRLSVQSDRIELRDLELESRAGTASGSVLVRPHHIDAKLTLADLDVPALLASFGIPSDGLSGRVDARLNLVERGAHRTGSLHAKVSDWHLDPLPPITGQLAAEFSEEDVDLTLSVAAGGLATATLTGRGSLPGSIRSVRTLEEARGKATLLIEKLDIGSLSRSFLEDGSFSAAGEATGRIGLERTGSAATPLLTYRFETSGLVVHPKQGERDAIRMDIASRGRFEPAGLTRVTLDLIDGSGPWLTGRLEPAVRLDELAEALRSGTAERLLDSSIRAHIVTAPRPLLMLGAPGDVADGTFEVLLAVTGTLRHPDLDGSVTVEGIGVPSIGESARRLEVGFLYSATRERYAVEGRALLTEAEQARFGATGRLSWIDKGLGQDWSLHGEADLSRLELARLDRLVGAGMTGDATGKASVDLDRGRFDANADLALHRVVIDGHPVGDGLVRASVNKGLVKGSLAVHSGSSKLELDADVQMLTGGDGGWIIDPQHGAAIGLTAREFDLGAVAPFVKESVLELAGDFNCRARFTWGQGGPTAPGAKLKLNATVADGVLKLAAGGGRIEQLDVTALSSEGESRVDLTVSGAALSSQPNIRGKATVHLDGVRPKAIDADVRLDRFPIVYEGIRIATATIAPGSAPVTIQLREEEEQNVLDVGVPSLEINLPETPDADVISLDEDPAVTVVEMPRAPEAPQEVMRSSNWVVKFQLGDHVRVTQAEMNVPLRGSVQINPDGTLRGTIEVPDGGVVPVMGNVFRITQGSLRFEDTGPEQGVVSVDAATQTTEGTEVFLAVRGAISDPPSIRFYSDPPQPEDELIALLLGVQPEDTYNQEAQGLGGTVMALAMNQALRGSPLARVQFGAGQTSQGESVTTASTRVSRTVWIEGRAIRANQSSVNPEDRVSGVVDWRFAPNWSLRTQLGQVSGLELRWYHRY